jgi:hypothetical protein
MWVLLCTAEEQKNFGAYVELYTLFSDLSVILYFYFIPYLCIFNVHVSSNMNTAGVGDFGKAPVRIGSTDDPRTMLTPAAFSLQTDLFLSCR